MRERNLCLVLLGATLIGFSSAAPSNTNEVEARNFVDKASEKLSAYCDNVSQKLFNLDDMEPQASLDEFMIILKLLDDLIGVVNDSKAFDYSQFKDKELKYIFKKIGKAADDAIVGVEKYWRLISALSALFVLSSHKDIEGYKDCSMDLAYFPDIQKIIAKTNDPEELKYYWNAWREKNHVWAKINFDIIVENLKEAASLTEISALDLWIGEYNVSEMEHVMTQIEPLYKQMHAFIRHHLVKKYGEDVIKPNGPIPDHLFQQVLAQTWTNGSAIDEVYPHKDLPPYNSILEKNQYDALKLYKTADTFYESLGFQPIPDDLWGKKIKMRNEADEGDCKATLFDLCSNVHMRYCQKVDFRKFLQAHGYLGRLTYAREKANLPAYYISSYDLEYSVAEAVILSASTPKHLNAIGLVTDFKFTDEVFMNRLLRMGIHTLFNIPVYFVHTKVMADLLAETITLEEVNKHYWRLMNKYVGVEPPIDRETDSFDFPFKFYLDLNKNPQAKKFDSEVLGYQFYQKFCEISGQYPKDPIQNCDFYGSKRVGDAMKKMMKLGSSKPIHEVMATLLPENPSVNADSLLEYYRPVKKWLTDKNQEANVKVGWTRTVKKTT